MPEWLGGSNTAAGPCLKVFPWGAWRLGNFVGGAAADGDVLGWCSRSVVVVEGLHFHLDRGACPLLVTVRAAINGWRIPPGGEARCC
jgi:hypothetical protein